MNFKVKSFFTVFFALGLVFITISSGICGIFSSSKRETVKIEQIYKDFDNYCGRIVNLEGTVIEQDERGYDNYLVIQDGTGMIKVQLWVYDIRFNEFAQDKKISVTGKISSVDGVYVINATKIFLGQKVYRKSR
jgi:uncharacterized protein YdeI (BOF family)